MKKTSSQLANEIHQMSLKACYAYNPGEAKRSRILLTVFLREMLHAGKGSHVEIASALLSKSGEACTKEQARVLARAAVRKHIDFGMIVPVTPEPPKEEKPKSSPKENPEHLPKENKK